MNEEIDESEFYHQDFTTASEWELFISRIEEIILIWRADDAKISENKETQLKWQERSDNLHFFEIEFKLTHYRHSSALSNDDSDNNKPGEKRPKCPMDHHYDFQLDDNDHSNNDRCIADWYGLQEYIILSPLNNAVISSESRIKILLSSINIAIANINCEIPIFVQIREKWQKLYLGVYEANGLRINFDMVHLKHMTSNCKYATDLLDVFRAKIDSPVTLDRVEVSIRNTYQLTDFGKYVWKQENIEIDENFDSNNLTVLPFGVTYDPISTLSINTKWSREGDYRKDKPGQTDFDPMKASVWTISASTTEQPICLLSECLTEFIHAMNNNLSVYDVLGDYAKNAANPTIESNPLDLLTEPQIPTISTVLKKAARNSIVKQRKGVAPLSEDILVPLLYYLFPDATDEALHPYDCSQDKIEANNSFKEDDKKTINNLFRGYKTCTIDSLVSRLAITLAQAMDSLGGTRAFAHLWFEFVQEMRYRWEKTISIPGLSPGYPDPRTCLLHQKLQMLNCCIERKASRESETRKSFDSANDTSSSADDDEFFDAVDAVDADETPPKRKHVTYSWDQPVGRLGRFENLKLIKTGEPLYIPITQDPVPKTEDQLEEDTNVLLELGSDAQGSELRAKMMSASLLSDMESFKAANPNSILEDFIRWYSPRDWIEGEDLDEWGQKIGRLSSRMLIAGNTWVEIWGNAKPVPSHRQRRLFDDTREAEKVLHFLNSRTISQVIDLLLPVLAQSAIYRLAEEYHQVRSSDVEELQRIVKTGERLSREGSTNRKRYENLVQDMAVSELTISQMNSLLYKFNPSGGEDEDTFRIVKDLVSGKEVELQGRKDSKVGASVLSMFAESRRAINALVQDYEGGEAARADVGNGNGKDGPLLPEAWSEREIVLRVDAHRPAAYSAKCPQFLRSIVSRNGTRMMGAFSEDTVFT